MSSEPAPYPPSPPPQPRAVTPDGSATATTEYRCIVCQSAFDDGNHAPRRTPCCRRLMCSKCAYAVVSHPTPPPCYFCSVVPSSAIEIRNFPVDRGMLDAALAASAPPASYV